MSVRLQVQKGIVCFGILAIRDEFRMRREGGFTKLRTLGKLALYRFKDHTLRFFNLLYLFCIYYTFYLCVHNLTVM